MWWNHHIFFHCCCQVTGWPLTDLWATGLVVLDELNLAVPSDCLASDAMQSYSTRKSNFTCRVLGKRRRRSLTIAWDDYLFLDINRCNFARGIQWTTFHRVWTMPCEVISFATSAWEFGLGTLFLLWKVQAWRCATWLRVVESVLSWTKPVGTWEESINTEQICLCSCPLFYHNRNLLVPSQS